MIVQVCTMQIIRKTFSAVPSGFDKKTQQEQAFSTVPETGYILQVLYYTVKPLSMWSFTQTQHDTVETN